MEAQELCGQASERNRAVGEEPYMRAGQLGPLGSPEYQGVYREAVTDVGLALSLVTHVHIEG